MKTQFRRHPLTVLTIILTALQCSTPGDPYAVDVFLQRLRIETIAVTADETDIARSAFRRYGKGMHPAGLNFGDCFAYALSKAMVEPLLFVGADFKRTDVDPA